MTHSNSIISTNPPILDPSSDWDCCPKRPKSIPFSKLGRLHLKHAHKNAPPDLLDLMGILPKGPRDLFLVMKNNMDYKTNRTTLSMKFSESQLRVRSRYYKELHKINLVKKMHVNTLVSSEIIIHVPKGTYMINPEYIIPENKLQQELLHIWRLLL